MKNLSPSLTICCDLNGDLIFVAETDSAMVASRYFNLNVTKLENSDAPIDGNEVSCRVDSKQLALCFSSNQVNILFYFSYTTKKFFNENKNHFFSFNTFG